MNLVFCCQADNDLYRTLCAGGTEWPRYELPAQAVERASTGAGVLLLADGYPAQTTAVVPAVFETARARNLRLYIEFPAQLPGLAVGQPQGIKWERAVVASNFLAPALERLRILAIHGCRFVPIEAREPAIVMAHVAGLDSAVYGLPAKAAPILFEQSPQLLVATTKLSQFLTARYAPSDAWCAVWRRILAWLCPGDDVPAMTPEFAVVPSFRADAALPADVELRAFGRGVEWFKAARMLPHPSWQGEVARCIDEVPDGIAELPDASWPAGDGTRGVLEGFVSSINPDGTQPVRCVVRNDCTGETAMAFAFAGTVNRSPAAARIAGNLIDFVYLNSPLGKGPREDPKSPSFGLVDWFTTSQGAYYGDDNARSLMGAFAVAALAKSDRWDEPLLRCLLANLRTTGKLGFRGNRLDEGDLQKYGWRHYFERDIVNCAPHYESYLWACYLWAYRATGFELFLQRAESAIRLTMEAYPNQWRWANGMQQERARMVLPLAWLVRVQDTPTHRQWLRRVSEDLLAAQVDCGGLREELGGPGLGRYGAPASNEEYGTKEATLLQKNGDPIVDLLYTTNFAFLGLHEAAAATGERLYAEAEERIAKFLCRIQARSQVRPELDGAWFRAFDYGRWEFWASNADLGWGAWSVETGWTQAWIVALLGLRHLRTSFWDVTAGSRIKAHLPKLAAQMLDGK